MVETLGKTKQNDDVTKMDVFEAIYERRSIRKFLEKPVEHDKIVKILDAGRWAPSGGNTQPWRFIVVDEKNLIKMIKMFSPGMFSEPSVLIVICRDIEEARRKGGEDGERFVSIVDISMATQNMMLAAHALGLGTCVIRSFDKNVVRKLLEIPENIEPELLLAIGYPSYKPGKPPRKPLTSIVFFNKYGKSYEFATTRGTETKGS